MSSLPLLIVGLGNPGKKYAHTRHNLGAVWVSKLCQKYDLHFNQNSKLDAQVFTVEQKAFCLIPNSYMNLSGFSVQKACQYYKIVPERILVVHDELDLAPGEIRLKSSGGHGGHNGLRHIIEQLNSNHFKRLRIGIGRPSNKNQEVADYVLSAPSAAEQLIIDTAIEHSWQIIPNLLEHEWQKAMHILHKPKISK